MLRVIRFLPLIGLILIACSSKAVNGRSYPREWWEPVSREGAPAWEVLPQDAGPGEVILSKRNELGILSNFAATPFELDGQLYASVEGFWQMMKYPEGQKDERYRADIEWPHTRYEVSQMTAFDAKKAGSEANEIMKKLDIKWVTYNGKKIDYLENKKGEFYQLIWNAEMAKFKQNPDVKSILRKTGNLVLRPDHKTSKHDPPAWRYYDIWMEIRSQQGF